MELGKEKRGTMVIMNGEIVRNLYRLIEDVVPGGAVKETSDNTRGKILFKWS